MPTPPEPIRIEAIEVSPTCEGAVWRVEDEGHLAALVARILVGHYLHVQMVCTGSDAPPVSPSDEVIDAAIAKLRVSTDPLRMHRDGWVFQMISWIAAVSSEKAALIRAPQPRAADKGFDGLILHLGDSPEEIRAIICEDKATERPRRTIRDEVWPEIARIETGSRDAELMSEVSSLLHQVHDTAKVVEIIGQIYWAGKRRYRVSVTADSGHSSSTELYRLFKGYDSCVAGAVHRRRGETLPLSDLRAWMESFALKVIAVLASMKKHDV